MKSNNSNKNVTPQQRRERHRRLRRLRRLMEGQHLDPFRHLTNEHAARVLVGAIAIHHPAVIMPKEYTLPALLRANPREDFLRRLAASNN